MKKIICYKSIIKYNYPADSMRWFRVYVEKNEYFKKIAFAGDSTIDNRHWLDKLQDIVVYQVVLYLSKGNNTISYNVGDFSVDGATTKDLHECSLNKAVSDQYHPAVTVQPLIAMKNWKANVVVLSVGGNNYREALQTAAASIDHKKSDIAVQNTLLTSFKEVQETLLTEYKKIIDDLVKDNLYLKRIVFVSQYYPDLLNRKPYSMYTKFSLITRAMGNAQSPYELIEQIMNELYQTILEHAAKKNIEVVLADVTSSFNPLGGNHVHQIEPNEHGSKIIGKLIAEAIQLKVDDKKLISVLSMNQNGDIISVGHDKEKIKNFKVKSIDSFISESKYRHVGLFFSSSTNLIKRYKYGYETLMGKEFDTEFTRIFAFGLLDLSLVTIMASYLWRVAINDQKHIALRSISGIIAAPILLIKMVVGLAVMLALSLLIYGYDKLVKCFNGNASCDQIELARL